MPTYDYPLTDPFLLRSFEPRIKPAVLVSESIFTAQAFTYEVPFAAWEFTITIAADLPATRAQVEAFLAQMRGPANRVRLWHFARPLPRGTRQTNTVTTAVAAQGATSLAINLTGGTLLTGDLAGVALEAGGTQLVMLTADAAAGNPRTISFTPPLRGAVASGATITLDRPKAPFLLSGESPRVPYVGAAQAPEITMVFDEDTTV